ncbi:WhiB family transcriptional regulator [Mycobacterium intracellulare]|uniref:WhiB family transcriptional regulator n=1 Tax=Mycobacterium intracellulare TaxID=1767 RepID=UPI001CD91868|nr:WhiB family transcriptional regulator [Mycobacterium intracellulare]MCA2304864.1 WhiB family transcriptional regulator [Mycobacterium intracellulare]MCA2347105.1 WhiB family transcriptional regulator [Mycobacterium intracellulare]
MTNIRPLKADTGLCFYDDPDNWFRKYSGEQEAAAICANCPIIVTCAQNALRFGVTDGVWASVAMPGARNVAELNAARAQLSAVIDRYQHQSPESHQRSLRIRQAVHFAAVQRERRSQHPSPSARRRAPVASEALPERASA